MIPGAPNPLIWGNGDPLDELGRIDRSLRLRRTATAALSRTPTAAASTKWTLSFWIKRNQFGVLQKLFGIGTDNSGINQFNIAFTAGDQLALYWATGSVIANKITSRVFRDPSAWVHVVIAFDGTHATAEDRIAFYVNGVRETVFATSVNFSGTTYPWWNCSTLQHLIGMYGGTPDASDVYLAHVANVTDQALTPSAFGLVHPKTGQWRPRAKSVVKSVVDAGGANSFFLAFDDTSSLSTLTADASAKGSNFTASNVSLTAGPTYDSMLDTPTSNFATLSPIDWIGSATSLSWGGLRSTGGVSNFTTHSTIAVSDGEWFNESTCEVAPSGTGNQQFGLVDETGAKVAYVSHTIGLVCNSVTVAAFTYATGDVVGLKFNLDNNTITAFKNGVQQGSTSGFTRSGAVKFFANNNYPGSGSTPISTHNFGQQPFAYSLPAGSKPLNTKNLTRPSIARAFDYFKTLLITGNGTVQSVTGLNFTPDLVWIKARSTSRSHRIFNSLRGVGKYLVSNSTNAEATDAQTLTAFNNNGFSLGSSVETNNSAESMVAWAFKAGGAPVANNAGSIASQVSANQLAGISLVTYTGNGTAGATVGHGLNKAPGVMIFKNVGGATSWPVYHGSMLPTSRVNLDQTSAFSTDTTFLNSVAPSSSLLTLGGGEAVNTNGNTHLAICFAEADGFSKIGFYSGNSSSNGPFIHCGFRPAFLLIKNISAIFDWYIYDSVRGPYNTPLPELYPNGSGAEGAGGGREIDFLSNGFKLRNTNQGHNASGNNYIYMAFAEFPFRYANAR